MVCFDCIYCDQRACDQTLENDNKYVEKHKRISKDVSHIISYHSIIDIKQICIVVHNIMQTNL